MSLPFTLANGPGNVPDATQLMANFNALLAGKFQIQNGAPTQIASNMSVASLSFLSNTGGTALTIQGLSGGIAGQILIFFNDSSSNNVTFVHNGSGTQVFYLGSSGNMVIGPRGGAIFVRNDTLSVWVCVGAQGVVLSAQPKIIQIVSALNTTQTTTTSNVYANTTLAATITPASSSNKIMVYVSCVVQINASTTVGHLSVKRGTTELSSAGGGFGIIRSGSNISQNCAMTASFQFIDSPGSTSPLTYTLCMKNDDNSTTVAIGGLGSNSDSMILQEIQ